MTLIEIFDRTPVENIITSLALRPEKTIFIGSDSRKMKHALVHYREIFDRRRMQIETEIRTVAKNDLESITQTLYEIIEYGTGEEQFVVDFSGGDESILVAMGMLLGSCAVRKKKMYAFRINVVSRRGVLFEILPAEDGKMSMERTLYDFSCGQEVRLTVEEDILLHGGRIVSHGVKFPKGDPLEKDVEAVWNIGRRDCTGWNAEISRFSGAVSMYSDSADLFMLPEIAFEEGPNRVSRELWEDFVRDGLVLPDEKRTRDGLLVFSYKNKVVEECLTKAGSTLEYLTYQAGLEEMFGEEPAFDDAEVSVVIDWDGEPNGTSNEIDCIFMRGMVPMFVSCKNGDVKSDELYKLGAVAEKFGSGYAKTALVSTVYFDERSQSYDGERAAETLKTRAEDMRIRMITNVHRMPDGRLGHELAKMIQA